MADTSHTKTLDTIRRCMLREPIAAELDLLVTHDPVPRVMHVAKVVHEASQGDDSLRGIIQESGLMEALRSEAIRRKTGEIVVCAPLTTASAKTKERERV